MKRSINIVVSVIMILALTLTSVASGSIEIQTIFDDDERSEVSNTTQAPYSAICNLTITYKSGSKEYGTGFLIAPKKVATAAHVMRKRNGDYAVKIVVSPGDKPGSHPYGQQIVTKGSDMLYPSLWVTADNADAPKYDYGVIRLAKAFNGNPATLSLNSSYSTNNYKNMRARITGYDYKTAILWKQTGKINKADSYLVYTKMDTLPGMSGSPITDRNNTVIGINCYGADGEFTWEEQLKPINQGDENYERSFNYGPRITSSVKAFLEQNGN